MKILPLLFLTAALPLAAQETKLTYPNPVKQIEKILKLPEKLDTLKQDYFLIYQFMINNGKAVSARLVHQFPPEIHSDYFEFAEEKLETMDFSELTPDDPEKWYGTSLRLKKKPVEFQKKSEVQLSYEEKFTWISFAAARFAGLNAEDFDYMMSKGYKDMLITVTVGTDGIMSFENLSENSDSNKDQRYWQIFRQITDEIRKVRLWNEYKNPFISEEDFTLYFNFYKKMEWKEQ